MSAVVWIRDGVLVHRMHINAVAFAFAAWKHSKSEVRENTSLEELINFAFEKSGISCADKMRLYESEREKIRIDVEVAVAYYNKIASEAANRVGYFPGALDLLRDLQMAGVHNFITSAVDQDVLDDWLTTEQGHQIDPVMDEVLGKRKDFNKGREHFEYISTRVPRGKIYYVADATSEIRTGRELAGAFNIEPVGFANVLRHADVLDAFHILSSIINNETIELTDKSPADLDVHALHFDDEQTLHDALRTAGASVVIGGSNNNIMQNLRAHFRKIGVL